MSERDPDLDMALRLLGSADPPGGTEDDARWAKKVVGALGGRGPKALAPEQLDALLAPPLPDDHQDAPMHDALADDDLIDDPGDAAHAAEPDARGDERGWENAISSPPTSGPTSGLDGLARLARSGPHPSSRAPAPEAGAAKGEDSGLIDLRGMSQSGEKPVAPGLVANAASTASGAASSPSPSPSTRAPAPAIAERASAPAPSSAAPSSSAAAAASAPNSAGAAPAASSPSSRTSRKKGGVVWIAFGGLAAAAAAGLFLMQSRKSEPTSATLDTRSAPAGAATIGVPSAVAAASTAAPVDMPAADPSASAVASASAAPTDDIVAAAPTVAAPKADLGGKSWAAGSKKAGGSPDVAQAPPSKDVGKVAEKPGAAPTGTANPPPQAGSGGGLDDVLGLNKPAMPTSTVASTPNLPDKPEAADIRVAVNARVGAASACVKGLSGESSIVVQFSPAGTVSSVSVTAGPAKGTGAEACIKSAFASAKVPRSKLGGTGYAKAFP